MIRSKATTDSSTSHVIRYRPDIDGLRAIAVLSVVAFHLSNAFAPAGYLGVDMFFVLSGYLITLIIWTELLAGTFRITTFYDRRIRRIMPAMLLMIFIVTVLSAAFLLPADLIGYARSVLSSLTFVANIYFWRDTDYFSRAAETKPLLHLWSLGIEEQFYILFPLMLWLVARLKRQSVAYCISAVVIVSLVADITLRRAGGASPAFFLLPTRAWELGLGALISLIPAGVALPRTMHSQAISLLGAGLVVVGMLNLVSLYSELPPALPVVFGTGLLLLAGRGQHTTPAVNHALALRPLVFFGKISYSLYLWHWPIIVLSQYCLVRSLSLGEALIAVLLMLALATISWHFVERPFRDKSMPIERVRSVAAVTTSVMAMVAVGLIATGGLPNRLNSAAASINEAVDTTYRCGVTDFLPFGSSRACVMNLPSRNPADADLILLGNSHAQMYAPVWRQIVAEHGKTGLLVPLNGCLPTVTVNTAAACFGPARTNLAAVLALPRAKTVVLGVTWNYGPQKLFNSDGKIADNRHDLALAAALDDLIGNIETAGKHVILIGPIAEPGYDIASNLSRNLAFGHPIVGPTEMPLEQFRQQFGPVIAHFEVRSDITFVRPDKVQCGGGACRYVIGNHSLFSDSNHIALAALPMFRQLFEEAYNDRRIDQPSQ